MLKILDSCGSDVIELGVPYSDPLADGPVIQAAAYHALKGGTTLSSVLAMLKEVIPELSCPIVLFTYCNPIPKLGVRNFMTSIEQAGVNGLVVPDLPLEETTLLRSEANMHNIELIAGWGADGVIIGSAIVRQLGEAASPEEGLKRIEEYAKSIKAAIP
ncbi:hypothetical protein ACQ4PT_004609 [Festuca glaucescens]